MVAPITVQAFGGMLPAMASELLAPNAAEYAVNAWLETGVLNGFHKLKEVVTASIPVLGKAYRIPDDYDAPYVLANSIYLWFANPDTDVIRGSVFGDTYDRYYWASSSGPPQYNTRARIENGDPAWLLGIPTPAHAPTLVVTGGTTPIVSRAYVVTYVSEYGEEGAPSPPANATGNINGLWALSNLPVPDVADQGVNRNITKKRIYRTIVGSTGVASFFMVVELPATTLTYDDTLTDTAISGNAILEPIPFTPPPADLEGFCMGPNGILAGWRGNEIWFSEAYRPHAWPSLYVLTVEYPVVGLASIYQTFYVMTRGYPVTITGSTPGTMQVGRVAMFEPCTSRGGIVTFPEGVYYPSGNGLILLQAGAALNITKGLITKENWQFYVKGARFRAAKLGANAYYGYGTVQFGVFQTDTFQNDAFAMEDYSGAYNGLVIDPTNQRFGLILLQSDIAVNNVQNDAWSSELILIKENKVYWLDLSDPDQVVEPAIWHSKTFTLQWKSSYAAAKIFFNPGHHPMQPQNPVRDTNQNMTLTDDKYGIITWYGDDRKLAVHEIRKSGELLRLPSETKYDEFRFEIETRVDINSVHVASTSKDLRAV